ncbi:hypothetical protein FS749_010281 [Ceratobasidium sp. UAMH 11750]|nr:hypothetical protein FS749_010281 [Ceratobasidium sp. UAMH 11750]
MFKVPKTALTVLQRGGRGGRDKAIKCRVVLMVEASKHKAALSKLTPDPKHVKQAGIKKEEDVPVVLKDQEANRVIGVDKIEATQQASVHGQGEGEGESEATIKALRIVSAKRGKADEEYLRRFYAPSDTCRTLVLNAAFCSPPHPPCISVNRCDNCIRRRIKQLESDKKKQAHQSQGPVKQEPVDNPDALSKTVEDLRALLVEPQAKEKPPKATVRKKHRRKTEREQLEDILKLWRSSIYDADCKRFGIHADYIITDMAIRAISDLLPPVTLESLSHTTPAWPGKALARWGQSLLAVVQDFDSPKSVAGRSRAETQLKQELHAKSSEKPSKAEPKAAAKSMKAKKWPATSEAAAAKPKKPRTQAADSATSAGASSFSQATSSRPAQPAPATQASACAPPMETGVANTSRLLVLLISHLNALDATQPEQKPVLPAPQPHSSQPSRHYRPHTYPRALPVSGTIKLTNSATVTHPGERTVGTIQVNPTINTVTQSTPPLSGHGTAPASPIQHTVKNPAASKDYYRGHLWGQWTG